MTTPLAIVPTIATLFVLLFASPLSSRTERPEDTWITEEFEGVGILLALGLGWAGISGAPASADKNTPEAGEQATEVNKPLPPQAIAEGVALFERVHKAEGMVGLHFVVKDCYAREVTQSSLYEATICMTADIIGYVMSRQVAREYRMPVTPGFFEEITWGDRLVQSLDNFPHIARNHAYLQIRDNGFALLWQPRK